jgi:5-methylcytosine-specific restriction protein A
LVKSENQFQIIFQLRRDDAPAYFSLIGPYNEKQGWQMNPNLVEALRQTNSISKNNTYLFVWNPKRWTWETLEQDIEQVDLTGKCSQRWSCGNTKSIQPGDRIFLVKLGVEPKGIIGAGFATTEAFPERHWSGENKEAFYIDIDFEVLLNPDKEPILTLDLLKTGKLAEQNWTPQASGISIRPELIDELEAVWFDFLTTQNIRHNPFILADNETQKTYTEGTPNQVTLTKYERNPFARKKCIDIMDFLVLLVVLTLKKIMVKSVKVLFTFITCDKLQQLVRHMKLTQLKTFDLFAQIAIQ